MDRFDFYLAQLVSESEVDGAFDAAEQADWDMMADFGLTGVAQGLVPVQHAPTADLTIDVSAGVAYDVNGKRIEVGSGQTVDMSVDSDSNSTAVGSGGNSKVVSLFLFADRTLSDPRVDGNSNTVQFSRAETFAFKVVQGNEATTGTEVPPSLEVDKVLLADVTLDFSQTQILDADINANAVGGNRRQDAFVLSAGSISVRAGTPETSDQGLITELNNHVTGVSNQHPATAISAAIAATWHDGASVSGTDVDAVLEEIVNDLVDNAGSDRIGAAAHTAAGDGLNDLSAGSIQDQLRSLADSTCKHDGAQVVSGNWDISGAWQVIGSGTIEFPTAGDILLPSVVVTRLQTGAGYTSDATIWERNSGSVTGLAWDNIAEDATQAVYFHLDIPDGATLDSVTVNYQGASGHASDPVDSGITMPFISVIRVDKDNNQTVIGNQSDTVTTRALYEAAHAITLSSIAHTIDRGASGYQYAVRVFGETGAEFLANGMALSCEATYTMTSLTEY